MFFIDADAALLPELFAPGEVDRLYINFCDPWPKSNQKKRRLTHGNFLKKYRQVLKGGGQIHFKTDNDKLFDWSVEEIPQFGFTLSDVTQPLRRHHGGLDRAGGRCQGRDITPIIPQIAPTSVSDVGAFFIGPPRYILRTA